MRKWHKLLIVSLLGLLFANSVISVIMRFSRTVPRIFTAISFIPFHGAAEEFRQCGAKRDVSLAWYPPVKTEINDLDQVFEGEGTNDMIFDSSAGPKNIYNYCNMPHVNPETYPMPEGGYELAYVEVIHRHHKRTPYSHSTFPSEGYTWYCDDETLYVGAMAAMDRDGSRNTFWQVYQSPLNPLLAHGFNGSCQFPQITRGGLEDAHHHGNDLKDTYFGKNQVIPEEFHSHALTYRVTNNPITAETAAMVLQGMYMSRRDKNTPLYIQPKDVDSLEPAYRCKPAKKLYATFGPGSDQDEWQKHLRRSNELRRRLDYLSGVDPDDEEWNRSWDHYFDNLSSRLCHDKPLPCSKQNEEDCVTRQEADQVFRLGEYEYSYIYRDHPDSLNASVAAYGIWVAELAQNLRYGSGEDVLSSFPGSSSRVKMRHNVAHDGSIAHLLSILQINQMVWPGMGAELSFEVYIKDDCNYLRVLWGGQIMRSSHPDFDRMDMVPLDTVLAYFDGLVGVGGSKIPALCELA